MKREEERVPGKESRQVYRKPELRRVELVTGEVLAEGCKMAGGGLNLGDNPNCGLVNGCNASGS